MLSKLASPRLTCSSRTLIALLTQPGLGHLGVALGGRHVVEDDRCLLGAAIDLEPAVDLGAAVELAVPADGLAVARLVAAVDVPQVGVLVVLGADRLAADVGHALLIHVARAVVGEDGGAGQREDVIGVDELVDAADVARPAAGVVTGDDLDLAAVDAAALVERVEVGGRAVVGAAERPPGPAGWCG